jgi:phosphoribosylamine--glycine ligase
VLTVVGRGRTLAEAIARAYAGVEQISFDGMQYRRDIGKKARVL